NLAVKEGYAPIMENLAEHIPESAEPAPGNKVRLIEMIDGQPYWQGDKIPEGAEVPMEYE
ncbi:MAG: hypothetical protein V5A59_12160, partial [Bacteroidales bacterium]